MQLKEGKNGWENFGPGCLASIVLHYDGEEAIALEFHSKRENDRCEVIMDWEEEIKSFRQLFQELYYRGKRQCKLYPDDFRGLMMRGAFQSDEFELTFLKNYQFVRVAMELEKSRRFLETVERMFMGPGRYELYF